MKEIPLHGRVAAGRVALVDDEDYELVMRYRWHVWEHPATDTRRANGPYARSTAGQPQVRTWMHTLIMESPRVDHIDHGGLNNQRSNLRPVTVGQNTQNSRPQAATSSPYKGVTWHRRLRKWQVTIRAHDKNTYLGVFADEVDAALAYDAAARAAWGDYAYLNFKDAS